MPKLSELKPAWVGMPAGAAGPTLRKGLGVSFECDRHRTRVMVFFSNPFDGWPGVVVELKDDEDSPPRRMATFHREGGDHEADDFDSITLTPKLSGPMMCCTFLITAGVVTRA